MPVRHATSFAAIITLAAALTSAQAVSDPARFTDDDLPKIVRVTDPQISPDGRTPSSSRRSTAENLPMQRVDSTEKATPPTPR